MKLLLHICCAPCLIYPLEQLREKKFKVTGFFYNPNVHSFSEYNNRKQAVWDFNREHNHDIEVIYPKYNPQEFFQAVNPVRDSPALGGRKSILTACISNGVNLKKDKLRRCSICWSLRLQKTAEVAKEMGHNYFSTTLLVSPYQDHELLKKIGSDIAKVQEIDFYYEDFRPGFKSAHEEAKAKGIYCQKYCGCIYSMSTRLMER
jgi:predicted adenine nucleotide alpha hydrolase (AANH) superfamily ATPase